VVIGRIWLGESLWVLRALLRDDVVQDAADEVVLRVVYRVTFGMPGCRTASRLLSALDDLDRRILGGLSVKAAFSAWIETMAADKRTTDVMDSRVLVALHTISKSHCNPSLTLPRIARIAGVSSWHLARMMKIQTGFTVGQQVQLARVNDAKGRLMQPGSSIKGVAVDVGYNSTIAFARAFRRVTNMTPSSWHKREREHGAINGGTLRSLSCFGRRDLGVA
jgi:AraC-like DNA-binding protein